jgi:CheY-like chemotaxis protein
MAMSQARNILIADPDLESVRALTRALREKGYQVHYAPDGSRALEVAVLRHPELVLFDEACQMLEARAFIQIIRTNPRTSDIPVVLTTATLDGDKLRAFRDGFLKKPFNLDEVLARIDHLVRRSEAARDLKSESDIEGSLSQLAIPDLLQILAMNRRSGRLMLTRGVERGEIHVGDGRPMNARTGVVEGEKALFRLLSWTEGSFSFTPGAPPSNPRINRGMDDALLEGMRQADEVGRLLPSLPPRTARLYLAPDAAVHTDQHPVTAQVMDLLRQPRSLGDVLDLSAASDHEVLTVLSTLLQKGVARVAEQEEAQAGPGPLLGPADVHALRSRLFRGRSPARSLVAKIFICGNGPEAARQLLAGLPGLHLVAADPPAIRSGFGTVGRLEINETLQIDFCILPPVEAARPLWRPFSAAAVGALVFDDSEPATRIARWLGWDARVPLAIVGEEVPATLQGAPGGAAAAGTQVLEAVRALLVQSLRPSPQADLVTAAG